MRFFFPLFHLLLLFLQPAACFTTTKPASRSCSRAGLLNKGGERTVTISLNPRPVLAQLSPTARRAFLSENNNQDLSRSYVLSDEEVNPIIRLPSKTNVDPTTGKPKEKTINAFGLWCAVVTVITCPIWVLAMTIVSGLYEVFPDWDPHHAVFDRTGKIWAKSWMIGTFSLPTYSGNIERLHDEDLGPCLFVANHASWLDIPVLVTVLDTGFKFIAKGDLLKVPCIGQQLEGGNHILIDREDRRSQLRTFKDGMAWLKKGVSLVAFPEGKRSPDGRLMELKGGLFSMAVKSGVPIVPITISHTHAIMPANVLLPVQPGAGKLHVHVHAPINSHEKSEGELGELVRQAFLETLPLCQRPEESGLEKAAKAAEKVFKEAHQAALNTLEDASKSAIHTLEDAQKVALQTWESVVHPLSPTAPVTHTQVSHQESLHSQQKEHEQPFHQEHQLINLHHQQIQDNEHQHLQHLHHLDALPNFSLEALVKSKIMVDTTPSHKDEEIKSMTATSTTTTTNPKQQP